MRSQSIHAISQIKRSRPSPAAVAADYGSDEVASVTSDSIYASVKEANILLLRKMKLAERGQVVFLLERDCVPGKLKAEDTRGVRVESSVEDIYKSAAAEAVTLSQLHDGAAVQVYCPIIRPLVLEIGIAKLTACALPPAVRAAAPCSRFPLV